MTLDDLLEIEAIKRVKYAYLRCLDQKLWDDLTELLTPECTASYGGGAYTFENREEIMRFLRESMGSETFLSSHRCHHPEIDITGPASATGVWAMDDFVVMQEWDLTVRGSAFYSDDYVKTDAGWKIARTGYQRMFEEIQPRANVEGLRLTASWWGTGGRSELGT